MTALLHLSVLMRLPRDPFFPFLLLFPDEINTEEDATQTDDDDDSDDDCHQRLPPECAHVTSVTTVVVAVTVELRGDAVGVGALKLSTVARRWGNMTRG